MGEQLRSKRDEKEEYKQIWEKGLPFKMNFFMWRAWKRRIATDDNLKRMKMYVVSRCWCCDMRKEETMEHLFLTAPIAEKLWRQFAVFADIHIEDMDMKQIIDTWWTMKSTPKNGNSMQSRTSNDYVELMEKNKYH